jgi:hypothetical protein
MLSDMLETGNVQIVQHPEQFWRRRTYLERGVSAEREHWRLGRFVVSSYVMM